MCKDGKTLSTYKSLKKKIYRIHFENDSFDLIYQGTFGFSTAIAAVSFRIVLLVSMLESWLSYIHCDFGEKQVFFNFNNVIC